MESHAVEFELMAFTLAQTILYTNNKDWTEISASESVDEVTPVRFLELLFNESVIPYTYYIDKDIFLHSLCAFAKKLRQWHYDPSKSRTLGDGCYSAFIIGAHKCPVQIVDKIGEFIKLSQNVLEAVVNPDLMLTDEDIVHGIADLLLKSRVKNKSGTGASSAYANLESIGSTSLLIGALKRPISMSNDEDLFASATSGDVNESKKQFSDADLDCPELRELISARCHENLNSLKKKYDEKKWCEEKHIVERGVE